MWSHASTDFVLVMHRYKYKNHVCINWMYNSDFVWKIIKWKYIGHTTVRFTTCHMRVQFYIKPPSRHFHFFDFLLHTNFWSQPPIVQVWALLVEIVWEWVWCGQGFLEMLVGLTWIDVLLRSDLRCMSTSRLVPCELEGYLVFRLDIQAWWVGGLSCLGVHGFAI